MSLDGIVTRAVVRELAACEGARINKIYQPSEHDVVLLLRAQGRSLKLLLSANPTYPRLHETEASYTNPTEAPMFCMLMRKHCEGGIVESVTQVGMERIVHIDIKQRDELGDIGLKRIVVELMGRHSNVILTDPKTGTVLDGIHHVTPAISGYRVVMPGSAYVPPPDQGKANPLEVTEAVFVELMTRGDGQDDAAAATVRQRLVDRFSGISPLAAKEIAHRAGLADGAPAGAEQARKLWGAFRDTMAAVASHRYEPVIVEEEASGKTYFSVIALTHLNGECRRFDSVSACLEAYYGDKAERDAVKQRASDLLRFLQNEKSKNVKKLNKLRETMEEAKEADKHRILGELLTASLHLAQKGDESIEVVNFYDEEQKPVTIALDPQLTPSENAQRYFKKYAKLRNSLAAVEEQIAATRAEIDYLDTLLAQLDRASLGDIEGIRDELVEQGYIRDRGKSRASRKKKPDKPALTCYTSREGVPIYVGKNNMQNEYLTNRLARPNDTWLHTKDIPGSHVVIRADSFGEQTLQDAAMLAAYYSRASSSSRVPVDYTLIRHVRKPNGSKPGFVIYERQKTLFVTPDEQAVKSMPVSVK